MPSVREHLRVVALATSMICLAHRADADGEVRRDSAGADRTLPAIVIAGDSTAAPGSGWGTLLSKYFRSDKVVVLNRAQGGASSRTFLTSGAWARLVSELKANDVVLIQFGHNDSSPINDEPPPPLRARGSLPGTGDERREIENAVTGRHETVHTYGWYLTQMVHDVNERKAVPVVLGLTVRNVWHGGHVERGISGYVTWTAAVAKREQVPFIDVTDFMADKYERLGQAETANFFSADATHFTAAAAELYAGAIAAALSKLRGVPVKSWLSPAAQRSTQFPNRYLFWN